MRSGRAEDDLGISEEDPEGIKKASILYVRKLKESSQLGFFESRKEIVAGLSDLAAGVEDRECGSNRR